jgi:hypothetical protein
VASAGNPDTEVDTLVTIPSAAISDKIQEKRISMQGDLTIFQHLYWSTHGADADDFSIIGFPREFNKDEDDCNKNQLIMVLATAQAQRRALAEAVDHHGGCCLSWPSANFRFVLDK